MNFTSSAFSVASSKIILFSSLKTIISFMFSSCFIIFFLSDDFDLNLEMLFLSIKLFLKDPSFELLSFFFNVSVFILLFVLNFCDLLSKSCDLLFLLIFS